MINLASYAPTLKPEVDKVFQELTEKTDKIISFSTDQNKTVERIVETVSTEMTMFGSLMLNDMSEYLSEQVLELSFFSYTARQNKFYRANLSKKISDKYIFDRSSSKIKYSETNSVASSLTVTAGTAALGAILIGALSPSNAVVPIGFVVATSIAVFCVSYYKITPNANKVAFNKAVTQYLADMKQEFIQWFDKVEKYYITCVNELVQQIRTVESNA
ncbi:hypothetical protein NST58_03975 [Paenibacillus sp. FSL R10-2796]|uniref:hypothetical protein n=1 Tax=Paenibacillus sp. FSL R10-2796 TaxID=2954663 RepID=UPI0030D89E4A